MMDAESRSASDVPPLSTAAISALHHGNKIEAIKIVREERNIGLKEAKDTVEDYVRSQPDLQASFANAQAETKRSALLWLAVLIGLAFFAYQFFVKP
ncbi:MAG: ribosomal protein L7/L12 [candidate division Zixibacteria bacterium]|nr:ribosomal protein L7/L12 [candidate division Zixibacteria bacterium]